MKECLEEVFNIEEHDGFSFTPFETDDKSVLATEIKAFNYAEKGEFLPGNAIGNKYHVVLYRENEEGEISHEDHFLSILGDPVYYGARLIENGWFGLISRATTTSDKFISPIFDMIVDTKQQMQTE